MSTVMYQHASALYAYMVEHAEDGVYKGTKSGAFNATGISQTYYSPLFKTLEEMGCILPEYVGGRGRRYHIKMLSTPEPAEFERVWAIVTLTKRGGLDNLRADVEAIKRRLPEVDLRGVLLNLEQRLANVEKALDKRKGR